MVTGATDHPTGRFVVQAWPVPLRRASVMPVRTVAMRGHAVPRGAARSRCRAGGGGARPTAGTATLSPANAGPSRDGLRPAARCAVPARREENSLVVSTSAKNRAVASIRLDRALWHVARVDESALESTPARAAVGRSAQVRDQAFGFSADGGVGSGDAKPAASDEADDGVVVGVDDEGVVVEGLPVVARGHSSGFCGLGGVGRRHVRGACKWSMQLASCDPYFR